MICKKNEFLCSFLFFFDQQNYKKNCETRFNWTNPNLINFRFPRIQTIQQSKIHSGTLFSSQNIYIFSFSKNILYFKNKKRDILSSISAMSIMQTFSLITINILLTGKFNNISIPKRQKMIFETHFNEFSLFNSVID